MEKEISKTEELDIKIELSRERLEQRNKNIFWGTLMTPYRMGLWELIGTIIGVLIMVIVILLILIS